MRIYHTLLIFLLAGTAVAAQVPGSEAAALQPYLNSHVLTGAVTLIADKSNVLDLESVGSRDAEHHQAMTSDTEFWIASMTKAITASAVMILVDEGKVSLDDPVEKYLPQFRGQNVLVDDKLVPAAHSIKLREILSSTACLPFSSKWEGQHHKLDLRPLDASSADFSSEPLRCQPGTAFLYSNEGFDIAGRIIELVSGIPYETFLKQRIFDPLGMKDTTFWPNTDQLARLAKTYRADQTTHRNVPTDNDQLSLPFYDHDHRYPMPAGGLFSTATDVAHFCQMLLGRGTYRGKQILSESSVAAMITNQVPTGLAQPYGLGLYLRPNGFGHPGAYKTEMFVDTKNNLVTIFMVQQSGPWLTNDGERMFTDLREAWLNRDRFAKK